MKILSWNDARVLGNVRGFRTPSDHAPVLLSLDR